MKTIVLFLALILAAASVATAQPGGYSAGVPTQSRAVPLQRQATLPSSTYITAFKTQTGEIMNYTPYLKLTGSPKLWQAADTTEPFSLERIKADTVFSYFWKSNATLGYRAAVHIQFGLGGGSLPVVWRPTILLDSISKGGASAITMIGTKDSAVVGRVLYFMRQQYGNAACNLARLIVVKDSVNTNNNAGQFVTGFNVTP